MKVRDLSLIFFIYLFILFLAALGLPYCARALSSRGEQGQLYCSAQASHCSGFSLLRSTDSRRAGFSSCGMRALERRLSSCGSRA